MWKLRWREDTRLSKVQEEVIWGSRSQLKLRSSLVLAPLGHTTFIMGNLWNSIMFHIDMIPEATKFSIPFYNLLLSLMKALFLIST